MKNKLHCIKHRYYILIVILLLIFITCKDPRFKILSLQTGSDINSNGTIKNSRLFYKFKDYKKNGKIRELFNYIYFEGDALFFSAKLNKIVNKENIHAAIINPENSSEYKFERIEILNKTIYGFSLIGSILENFYKNIVNEKIPENRFCCIDIPFKIKLEINYLNENIKKEINSSFKLEYK